MADVFTATFTQDPFGDPARVNVGIVSNGQIVGTPAEWVAVEAPRGSAGDVVTLEGDFPADVAFYVSFLNDEFQDGVGDRNVQLVGATINGVAIEGAAFDMFEGGDYGPVFFDGDAASPPVVPGRTISGTSGPDTLAGAAGPDTISGLGGDDELHGLSGDDDIRGGAGSDRIYPGPGNDTVTTNSGRDVIAIGQGNGSDTVRDFNQGFDAVWLLDGLTAEDFHVEASSRGGQPGALITVAGPAGNEVWLPGVDATALEWATVIA